MMPKPLRVPQAPPPAAHEVAALVARAADGDVAAFERLAQQYHAKIFSFALSFTADRDEAADLAQEALVKVYRSIGSFRFQSSFTTWLFQIVKNSFLDAAKSRAARDRLKEEVASDEVDLAGAALADEKLVAEEDRRALGAALARVPEAFRVVVVMFDMQGFSYDEIAQVLGVPVGTVKSRLSRGREALREVIFRRQRGEPERGGKR